MGDKSQIEWTDATWPVVTGCTRVSPGCDHCYAFALHDRRHVAWKRGRWPDAPAQYHRPFSRVQLLEDRLNWPLKWRTPRRIFVPSMGDLFHEDVPDEFITRVFAVMALAPQHTFQVLTKRPERMAAWVGDPWVLENMYAHWFEFSDGPREVNRWPLPNVWLGTSVESQAAADQRIPHLLRTPAAVRFLSCEPLLGPIDLRQYLGYCPWCGFPRADWTDADRDESPDGCACCEARPSLRDTGIHWIIIGGESGPGARSMDIDWARWLIAQCRDAGVPVFVKQLGVKPYETGRGKTVEEVLTARPLTLTDRKGGDMTEWPEDLRVREMPAGQVQEVTG